jgi:acyl carrier protein
MSVSNRTSLASGTQGTQPLSSGGDDGIDVSPIEESLRAHPDVRHVVVTCERIRGEQKLVAYIVPEGPSTGTTAWKEYLRGKVAPDLVPSMFIYVDHLAVGPSGDLDRNALPTLDLMRPALEGSYVAPRYPAEAAMAEVWADALGLDQVGVNDDFLELGGDSLIAVSIMSHVFERFNKDLSFEMLFEYGTIAALMPILGLAADQSHAAS